MLPAAHRIRRSAEFATTIRGGRRAGRGGLVVHLAPAGRGPSAPAGSGPTDAAGAADVPPARVGFVVPRTVGGAVVRNRVRRRLRHLLRVRLGDLPAGTTLVVRVLPAAAQLSSAALAEQLDAAIDAARGGAGRGGAGRGSARRRGGAVPS